MSTGVSGPMFIRIGDRQRTFHTHGVPYPHGSQLQACRVRVATWDSSRRILARAYRDMRVFGLDVSQARIVAVNMLLVAP
jgi:hypothetical protein